MIYIYNVEFQHYYKLYNNIHMYLCLKVWREALSSYYPHILLLILTLIKIF